MKKKLSMWLFLLQHPPFYNPRPAFNFCGERKKDDTEIKNGERVFVFPVKRQHKERGGEKEEGRWRGKENAKKCLGQKGKENKGKEREWTWESRGLILALGFFSSSLFFQIENF